MLRSLSDCYRLRNGVDIPCVGLGTWQVPEGEAAVRVMLHALRAGYRHIDSAAGYGNEASVGRAVRESGLPREAIFVTTKLQNTAHGYEATLEAFEASMAKLGLDYLDLYLIHWPNPAKYRDCWREANAGSWRAFEELHEAGRIRAIGVSNFMPRHLDALLETARILPMVNQIRLCPGETQEPAAAWCRERDILLEAYSPLGTGKVFAVPAVREMAVKYGKSVAQVCLRGSLQQGYLPLPKSMTPERITENADIFDFTLDETDAAVIAGLKDCCGSSTDPDKITF